MISKDLLKELFDYKDGNLIWKINRPHTKSKGKIAGSQSAPKYIQVKINYKNYLLHRLIWIWHNGDIPEDLIIDHIDKNTKNNKIENLRLVTVQENAFNRNNKKYYQYGRMKGYEVHLRKDGKTIFRESYKTKQEAENAYLIAKDKYHQIGVRH